MPLMSDIAAPALSNGRGALWMAVSVVGAAAMTIGVRGASAEIDSQMIVMLRGIGGLILCWALLAAMPSQRSGVRFSRPWLHAARGALIAVSTQLGFYTLTQIPLATATVLFFSAPIFTTLLAPLVLKEPIGLRRSAAVVAGFCGVLIVVRPGAAPFDIAMVAAIASSFLFALVLLTSRAVANSDGPWAAYLSSAVMTIVVSLPLTVTDWSMPVSALGWGALGVVAVTSLVRNLADIQAYRYAEASFLAPLAYTRIILIAAAGYLLFDEIPDGWTIAGGAVITAAALYIAQRERAVFRTEAARRRAGAPPA